MDNRNGVSVGNVGHVLQDASYAECSETFLIYSMQSLAGFGRVSGDSVVLWTDGEPTIEFDPAAFPPAVRNVLESAARLAFHGKPEPESMTGLLIRDVETALRYLMVRGSDWTDPGDDDGPGQDDDDGPDGDGGPMPELAARLSAPSWPVASEPGSCLHVQTETTDPAPVPGYCSRFDMLETCQGCGASRDIEFRSIDGETLIPCSGPGSVSVGPYLGGSRAAGSILARPDPT